MPPDSSWLLLDIAELINKLWGRDMPGGRLFRGTVKRRVRPVGLAPNAEASVEYPSIEHLSVADAEHHDWTFGLFLAAEEERLTEFTDGGIGFSFKKGFEATMWPCDLVLGPAPLRDLLPMLGALETLEDEVQFVDRVFLCRRSGETLDFPRTPEHVQALGPAVGEERWYGVQADHAWDAYRHVRAHADVTEEPHVGRCPECSVTDLGRFDDRGALNAYLSKGRT